MTICKWILQYITDLSALLSQITAENIELHLQAQHRLLPLLFVFNHQNYSRYLTTHHVELTDLPSKHSSAYKDLQIYGIGASWVANNTRRCINRFTINRKATARRRPIRKWNYPFDAENDFVLISHILAELWR